MSEMAEAWHYWQSRDTYNGDRRSFETGYMAALGDVDKGFRARLSRIRESRMYPTTNDEGKDDDGR